MLTFKPKEKINNSVFHIVFIYIMEGKRNYYKNCLIFWMKTIRNALMVFKKVFCGQTKSYLYHES